MSEKHYKSLDDIPLYNWNKCMNGDLKYIRLDMQEHNDNELHFKELYDTYIKERGLGKDYKNYLSILKKKALLQCDYLITKDRFKLTQIEIEDAKLESLTKDKGESISIEKSLIYLSKWLGYRLDWKQVTANEYYLILDEYGKANKS
jgi:hypothetical protein